MTNFYGCWDEAKKELSATCMDIAITVEIVLVAFMLVSCFKLLFCLTNRAALNIIRIKIVVLHCKIFLS